MWSSSETMERNEVRHFQKKVARVTGLEPATSGVTGRHSNRLSYARAFLPKPRRPSQLFTGRGRARSCE